METTDKVIHLILMRADLAEVRLMEMEDNLEDIQDQMWILVDQAETRTMHLNHKDKKPDQLIQLLQQVEEVAVEVLSAVEAVVALDQQDLAEGNF